MSQHVIVLGGGIAGLSAAHELSERGFKVTIFERHKELPGGKARSVSVPRSSVGGRPGLPGEHGFRFFPGFYKNIIETMSRIPFPATTSSNYVSDNLISCPTIMIAREGQAPIQLPAEVPRSWREVMLLLRKLFSIKTGLRPGEGKIIARKIWQLMTSCDERWEEQYEKMSWWEYTDAANPERSDAYRELFVTGLTRSLVAAKAEIANTRTNGKILLQMLFNFTKKDVAMDRILKGPTNDMWITPWVQYLTTVQNVELHMASEVVRIETNSEAVAGVWISENQKKPQLHSADFYLCAVPVERAARLITPDLLRLDPHLKNIITLSDDVAWMNGVQFYLKEDIKISEGHIILVDSPWALTAISQIQFWPNFDLTQYGDGGSRGIISIDVSNWDVEGILYQKPAKACTKKEVIAEVWAQMKACLNVEGKVVLKDENLHAAYIDESLIFEDDILDPYNPSVDSALNSQALFGMNKVISNEEPLLVNEVDTWKYRNEARTEIPNFFLASDYVRNYTNLATMEGANEAAKLAVNGIIKKSGSSARLCEVFPLEEPRELDPLKALDRLRYRSGQSWNGMDYKLR